MGQCTGADDSNEGPLVEGITKGESAVLTSEDSCCLAFIPTADTVAEWQEFETDTYYRDLDEDRIRDGWM